jgi:glycosyltransferase involved in cell wall biosynthesis
VSTYALGKVLKRVSVVIPTHNSSGTLGTCLDSVQRQTYPNYEIIIVDKLSTDSTKSVAEEYGVKFLIARGNQASARNVGVLNSEGTFILLLDSDQSLEKDAIRECVDICSERDVGMVKIPEVFFGKSLWGRFSATWKNYHALVDELYCHADSLLHGEPRFFLRRHLITAGLFNEKLLWGENFDLYLKIKELGVKEAWARSMVYHLEPLFLKEILIKTICYGESLIDFSGQTHKAAIGLLHKNTLLALKEALKDLGKSPLSVVGCLFILYIRISAMTIGLLRKAPTSK